MKSVGKILLHLPQLSAVKTEMLHPKDSKPFSKCNGEFAPQHKELDCFTQLMKGEDMGTCGNCHFCFTSWFTFWFEETVKFIYAYSSFLLF